ncbi:hypothetical protein EDC04DRAFT_973401 [Pisolithus marmoratus]|nr:hypothetical protein EDC04DRAFT_973401 [Pisolithus marmoratus]
MDPTLLCWVRGDDVDDVFELEIPGEADVGKLKQALKDKRSATFSDVDAPNLHLYPLLVPSNADRAVELGKWRLQDKKPLYVKQKLSDVFPKFRNGKWVVVVPSNCRNGVFGLFQEPNFSCVSCGGRHGRGSFIRPATRSTIRGCVSKCFHSNAQNLSVESPGIADKGRKVSR